MLKKLFNIKYVYIIIFISLSAWSFFAYFTLNQLIISEKIYAKIINISGKQRMLSQKIPLMSKKIVETNSLKLISHTQDLLEEMEQNHTFLLKNITSEQVRQLYFNQPTQLNSQLEEFFSLTNEFLKKYDKSLTLHLEDYAFELLPVLNTIVNKYEKENNLITKKLQQRELFIFIGTLLTLLLEALFIVFPSIKKAEQKEKELKELNQELERRINLKIKQLRDQDQLLSQQSRMAAMGEMLENIAHQWRQPLSVISTAASGIKLKSEFNTLEEHELEHNMDSIVNNTNFLSNTIDDFRTFFRGDKERQYFKLEETYVKSMQLVSSQFLNQHISVITNIQDVEYFGFKNELAQVFMNILNNANDALKNNVAGEKRLLFVDIIKEEDTILIRFKDNAKGVPTSIQRSIFDSYFTTKEKEKGTGIGLYMSRKIIVEHFDGTLSQNNEKYVYENKEEVGACFTIALPSLVY